MELVKKKRHKPFYKQFLRLRKNVQNRLKLFKFKKLKWKKFQDYSKRQLGFFKRFKIQDQYQLTATKFASRGNSLKKKFRDNLHDRKTFSLFYGGLKKSYLKRHITAIKKRKHLGSNFQTFRHQTLAFFESRLDVILYRASFSLSIKSAGQVIRHGHVLVNGITVRTKSYILKTDDLIGIASTEKSRSLVKKSLDRSNFWPLPPKHLLINYRTLQIIFVYKKNANFLPLFNLYINVDSVVANIKKY
jgi:ribosomal protein S4